MHRRYLEEARHEIRRYRNRRLRRPTIAERSSHAENGLPRLRTRRQRRNRKELYKTCNGKNLSTGRVTRKGKRRQPPLRGLRSSLKLRNKRRTQRKLSTSYFLSKKMALNELDTYYANCIGSLYATNEPLFLKHSLEEVITGKVGNSKDFISLIASVSNRSDEDLRSISSGVEEAKTTSSSDNELELDLFNDDLMCIVCNGMDVGARNRLLECSDCHSLYHQECHRPPVTTVDTNNTWTCQNCKDTSRKMKATPGSSPSSISSITSNKPVITISPPGLQYQSGTTSVSIKLSGTGTISTTIITKSKSKTSLKSSNAGNSNNSNTAATIIPTSPVTATTNITKTVTADTATTTTSTAVTIGNTNTVNTVDNVAATTTAVDGSAAVAGSPVLVPTTTVAVATTIAPVHTIAVATPPISMVNGVTNIGSDSVSITVVNSSPATTTTVTTTNIATVATSSSCTSPSVVTTNTPTSPPSSPCPSPPLASVTIPITTLASITSVTATATSGTTTYKTASTSNNSMPSSSNKTGTMIPNINIITADRRLQIMKKKAAKLHEKRKQLPREEKGKY